MLIATASCIGNGLDSDSVYKVTHIEFPHIIINAVQEMGRCGRKRNNLTNQSGTPDSYTLMANIHYFFYLNERLYTNIEKDLSSSTSRVITFEDDRERQQKELLCVLKMFV